MICLANIVSYDRSFVDLIAEDGIFAVRREPEDYLYKIFSGGKLALKSF
jgi:hypothetical protein